MHTDSAEELLIIVQGTAEARVGDEVGRLETHQVGLVPPMAPHGLRNIGDDVLRVLGTFSASTVVSTFERPFEEDGPKVLVIGSPVAAGRSPRGGGARLDRRRASCLGTGPASTDRLVEHLLMFGEAVGGTSFSPASRPPQASSGTRSTSARSSVAAQLASRSAPPPTGSRARRCRRTSSGRGRRRASIVS